MVEEGVRLNEGVTLLENTREGISPNFQEAGYLRPDIVPLITAGKFDQCLISPRSAKEFNVDTNGAPGQEVAISLDLAKGPLSVDAVTKDLGTGLFINNLWYLNYSDRSACRTTGMTRFATFWVEGGQIKAPLNVMRFDETIYRVLGENLLGLTRERDMILDSGTYGGRATSSARMPGALVNDFTLTL
jgi:predicted Zn-dependent protease